MWKSNVPFSSLETVHGVSLWGHKSKFYKVFPVISVVASDTSSPERPHSTDKAQCSPHKTVLVSKCCSCKIWRPQDTSLLTS